MVIGPSFCLDALWQETEQRHQSFVVLRRPTIRRIEGFLQFLQNLGIIWSIWWCKGITGFFQHIFVHKLQPKDSSSCLRAKNQNRTHFLQSGNRYLLVWFNLMQDRPHTQRNIHSLTMDLFFLALAPTKKTLHLKTFRIWFFSGSLSTSHLLPRSPTWEAPYDH